MGQHAARITAWGVTWDRWDPAYLVDALSVYTEAEPGPGTARTDAALPRLTPQIVGAQSQAIEVVTITGGTSRRGGAGLQVGYRLAGEGVNKIRGLSYPTWVADWRQWGAGAGVHTYAAADRYADAALFPLSGRVAVLSGYGTSSSTTLAVWDPHTDDFLADATELATGTFDLPALAVEPGTERLLILTRTGAWYSDDYGQTRTRYRDTGWSEAITSGTFDGEYTKVRACWDGAGSLLIAVQDSSASPKTRFAASSDLGGEWTDVGTIDPTGANRLRWDLASHPDGSIFLVYHDPAAAGVYCKRLGGAYDDPSLAGVTGTVDGAATPSNVHAAIDANGVIWAYLVDAYSGVPPTYVRTYYSVDGGATWTEGAIVYQAPTAAPEALWLAARLVPCAYGGLCGPLALGGDDGTAHIGWSSSRAGFVRLGGWTAPDRSQGGAWAVSPRIHAFAARSAVGNKFTEVTGGGNSAYTLVDGGYVGISAAPYGYDRIDSGSGGLESHRYYTVTCSTSDEVACSGEWLTRVEADGAAGVNAAPAAGFRVAFDVRSAAANERRHISVRWDSAGFRVYDELAAAWLGPKVDVDLSVQCAFRLSMTAAGAVVTQHQTRPPHDGVSQAPVDRTSWVVTTWPTAATAAATVLSGMVFGRGQYVANALAASAWWRYDARAVAATTVDGWDVTGVGLGSDRYPVPDAHDPLRARVARLSLVGGPAVSKEVYTLDPAHGYPVAAAFPAIEPSPDVRWRSLTDVDGVALAVSTSDDYATLGTHPGGSIGIALVVQRVNVRLVAVRYYAPGDTTPVTLAELDLATGHDEAVVGCTAVRTAGCDYVTPGPTTGEGTRYLRAGELAGGLWIWTDSGVYRRIRTNSPGWWSATKGLQARVYLEGVDDGTDPTAEEGCAICSPSGVLQIVVSRDAAAPGALSIEIDPQTTVEGYYEAGTLALVSLHAPGKRWGKGAEVTAEGNVLATIDDYGTERRSARGPVGDTWTVTYDSPALARRVRSDDSWVGPSAGTDAAQALAAQDDVAWQLRDLLVQSGGGARPVLLLADPLPAYVAEGAGSTRTTIDPSLWCYGYLAPEIRTAIQQGDEGIDEVILAGPLTVRGLR